jgi:hypothetical protein
MHDDGGTTTAQRASKLRLEARPCVMQDYAMPVFRRNK